MCRSCGGNLPLIGLPLEVYCPYCGTQASLDSGVARDARHFERNVRANLDAASQAHHEAMLQKWRLGGYGTSLGGQSLLVLLYWLILVGLGPLTVVVTELGEHVGLDPSSPYVLWSAFGGVVVGFMASIAGYRLWAHLMERRDRVRLAAGANHVACPHCGGQNILPGDRAAATCVHCHADLMTSSTIMQRNLQATHQALRRAAMRRYRAERLAYVSATAHESPNGVKIDSGGAIWLGILGLAAGAAGVWTHHIAVGWTEMHWYPIVAWSFTGILIAAWVYGRWRRYRLAAEWTRVIANLVHPLGGRLLRSPRKRALFRYAKVTRLVGQVGLVFSLVVVLAGASWAGEALRRALPQTWPYILAAALGALGTVLVLWLFGIFWRQYSYRAWLDDAANRRGAMVVDDVLDWLDLYWPGPYGTQCLTWSPMAVAAVAEVAGHPLLIDIDPTPAGDYSQPRAQLYLAAVAPSGDRGLRSETLPCYQTAGEEIKAICFVAGFGPNGISCHAQEALIGAIRTRPKIVRRFPEIIDAMLRMARAAGAEPAQPIHDAAPPSANTFTS